MTDPAPGTRARVPRRTPRTGAAALAVLVTLGAVSCSRDEPTAQAPEPTEPSASASESPEPTPEAPGRLRSEVSLAMLPAIAQPGPGPAPAGQASPVLTATVEPAVVGGEVVLQRAGADGWSEVARAAQEPSGRAVFDDVPASSDARYRAVVVRGDARSQPGPVVGAAGWRSIFDDEFDGSGLDSSAWDYRGVGVYDDSGGRECSTSDPSAVTVGGGTLQLLVRDDPRRSEPCRSADGTFDYYLNGHVSTESRFGFTYGVAAARVKFQQGRGQHGAFWMQRNGSIPEVAGDPASSGAEIDVAEFFGEGYQQGGLASFVYYRNAGNEDEKVGGLQPRATQQLPSGDDWWSRYHVFSVEWTPERYVFRVDGREYYRTTEGVSGVDQFLVLSLLSSDWELGKLDPSTLPSRMDVDWVRVWQRSG